MSSRGAVPPVHSRQPAASSLEGASPVNRRRLLMSLSRLLEHRLEEPHTTPRRRG